MSSSHSLWYLTKYLDAVTAQYQEIQTPCKKRKRSVSFNLQSDTSLNHVTFDRSLSASNNTMATSKSNPDVGCLSPSANQDDLDLLAKLEAANRELEKDQKSLKTLTPPKTHTKGHSRQASISSVASNVSQISTCSNASYLEVEPANAEELWNLWSRIVSDWENVNKRKQQYIKDLVRKGVPTHFRGIVWQLLCGAQNSAARYKYADYLKMTSPMEKMIRRDITRTYPEHEFFKEKDGLGQESLFNVMKAYSLHDREVGYCQGSGFIVGLLLMQMPEEEAFSVLVKLMQEYNMRELFKPSMAELGVCMFKLEYLIQELLPELYSHFQAQSFSVSMFASSWFLTLFTTSLSNTMACRIFDIFLAEGREFMFRVAIAILQITASNLLSLDMEGMIKHLSKEGLNTVFENDPERLITMSIQVKYNAKKLKKLEKEYTTLKSKEQEDQVELRRLRTENRLLRQRIENLEKETATLADRLIHDQVRCAQQEEAMLALKKDLSLSRQQSCDTNNKLEELQEQYEQLKRSSSTSSSQASLETSLPEADQSRLQRLLAENQELRDREVDQSQKISQLTNKVKELESRNAQLNTSPSSQLETVQEELIASKLREAEANLSLKELQQRVTDLQKHWQKHMDKVNSASPNTKASKSDVRQMSDEIMTLRLREVNAISELKDSKQKLMELETQAHISARQVKRLDEEKRQLEEKVEEGLSREKNQQSVIQEHERKIADSETRYKEEEMMSRIKNAEHSQLVAEMRRRVAELEIENQELVTAAQIDAKGEKGDLQNKIADLQDEVLQLKMSRRLAHMSTSIQGSTDTDYDSDDLEATMRASQLQLTESLCGFELQNILNSNNAPTAANNSHPLGAGTELGDTSDTDTPEDQGQSPTTLKGRRRKKKVKEGHGVDLDRTPTQDNIDTELFLVDSEELDQLDTYRGAEVNKCNNTITEDSSRLLVERRSNGMNGETGCKNDDPTDLNRLGFAGKKFHYEEDPLKARTSCKDSGNVVASGQDIGGNSSRGSSHVVSNSDPTNIDDRASLNRPES